MFKFTVYLSVLLSLDLSVVFFLSLNTLLVIRYSIHYYYYYYYYYYY